MTRVDERDVHGKTPSCDKDGSTKHTDPPFPLVSAVSGVPSADFRWKMMYLLVACSRSSLLACIGLQSLGLVHRSVAIYETETNEGGGEAHLPAKFASVR
jgi:hypothetical protein